MAINKNQKKSTILVYTNKQNSTIPNGYKNHFNDPVKDVETKVNSAISKIDAIATKVDAIKAKTDTLS